MKRFSKWSVVLVAAAMAVCAVSMASMASAATWGPVGGNDQVLTSTNLGAITDAAAPAGWTCAVASFTTTVTATRLDITAATLDRCAGAGALVNCTATATPEDLPWEVTPTTPITIDDVHLTIHYEQKPGVANCPAPGLRATWTGNLHGGVFNDTTHTLSLSNAPGMTVHSGGVSSPATVTGAIIDDVSPFVTLT